MSPISHADVQPPDSGGTSRKLLVTGTLGILELCAVRGMIDLPSTLAKLLAANFHVRDDLIEGLLQRDTARRR